MTVQDQSGLSGEGATLDPASAEPDTPLPAAESPDGIPVPAGQPMSEPSPPMPPAPSQRNRLLGSALVTIIGLFVLYSPWPLQDKLHTIGHACCAQIPSHTITFGSQPMPIDARNSGIYTAVLMVIALMWLTGRRRAAHFVSPRLGLVLMAMVLAMIFDGFNSLAQTHHLHTYYSDSNDIRVITGTLAGMALTILTIPLFNSLIWKDPEGIAVAEDLGELVGYLAGALVIILVLLRAPAALYYPMSLLSIAGVLITLTFVNTCICVVSARRENRIVSLTAFIIPLLLGLTLTCLEIGAINYFQAWRH